jgi:hypothetical protein
METVKEIAKEVNRAPSTVMRWAREIHATPDGVNSPLSEQVIRHVKECALFRRKVTRKNSKLYPSGRQQELKLEKGAPELGAAKDCPCCTDADLCPPHAEAERDNLKRNPPKYTAKAAAEVNPEVNPDLVTVTVTAKFAALCLLLGVEPGEYLVTVQDSFADIYSKKLKAAK